MHTHVYTHIYTYTYTHTHTYLHIVIYTQIQTHTAHTHIYTYLHKEKLENCILCNIQFYIRNIDKWNLHLGNKVIFHDQRELPARSLLFNIFISNLDRRMNGDMTATSYNTKLFGRVRMKPIIKFCRRTSWYYTTEQQTGRWNSMW